MWSLDHTLELNLRKKLVQCYSWGTALGSADRGTLRKVDEKYLESFEMWCWRRMEKVIWTERVKNEVLQGVGGNKYPTYNKKEEVNWIGHILRGNCLLTLAVEGKIEGT